MRHISSVFICAAAALASLLASAQARAEIPATPVMTLYTFNGALDVPYYTIDSFERSGARRPAGYLAQGSSVVPCLVVRDGRPLTDKSGTPHVGFEVVVDSRKVTYESSKSFEDIVAQRNSMRVPNHHCGKNVKHGMDIRRMYALGKEPFFDPSPSGGPKFKAKGGKGAGLYDIVRAFHNSKECAESDRTLIGRRESLTRAWGRFVSKNGGRWPADSLDRARQLDIVMRTALYEGHLDRGCSAYGACERNVVALSIKNRGGAACQRSQGCGFPGDYEGVATKVSQYNIWDEYLTQISGIASCFLREDLSAESIPTEGEGAPDFNVAYYQRIRRMYEQNVYDVEKILFEGDGALAEVFPGTSFGLLKGLRHYYHPPAMGKCFPNHRRVEYMTGAVARKGGDFALIANTRIQVGKKVGGGYLFKEFELDAQRDHDVTSIVDNYPGFVVDARKVRLGASKACLPYGVSRSCGFKNVRRYRKAPWWARSGTAAAIKCKIEDRGEDCRGSGKKRAVTVGGRCDPQMQPVAGVR